MSNLLVNEGPCKAYVIARKDLGPFKCRDCGDKSVRFDLFVGGNHDVKAEDVKVCVYCATNKAREDIIRQIIPPEVLQKIDGVMEKIDGIIEDLGPTEEAAHKIRELLDDHDH